MNPRRASRNRTFAKVGSPSGNSGRIRRRRAVFPGLPTRGAEDRASGTGGETILAIAAGVPIGVAVGDGLPLVTGPVGAGDGTGLPPPSPPQPSATKERRRSVPKCRAMRAASDTERDGRMGMEELSPDLSADVDADLPNGSIARR
jgi:hypothetical protein